MAIQFTPVRVDDGISPDDKISRDLILWGKIFDRLWMAPYVEGKGSSGNIGFRMPHGICVTPSGSSLGELEVEDIMTVVDVKEEDGEISVFFYGHPEKKPTSEALIYWDIFKARDDADVVLHGHDSFCLEKDSEIYNNFSEEIAMTKVVQEAGSFELRSDIQGILSGEESYLVGKGHGFFALGKNFEEAGLLALRFRTEAINLLFGEEFIEEVKKKYDLL